MCNEIYEYLTISSLVLGHRLVDTWAQGRGLHTRRSFFLSRVRKIAKSDHWLRHVCLSSWSNWPHSKGIFMKFVILRIFSKVFRENSGFIKI